MVRGGGTGAAGERGGEDLDGAWGLEGGGERGTVPTGVKVGVGFEERGTAWLVRALCWRCELCIFAHLRGCVGGLGVNGLQTFVGALTREVAFPSLVGWTVEFC
jgi:hypothetical protein